MRKKVAVIVEVDISEVESNLRKMKDILSRLKSELKQKTKSLTKKQVDLFLSADIDEIKKLESRIKKTEKYLDDVKEAKEVEGDERKHIRKREQVK